VELTQRPETVQVRADRLHGARWRGVPARKDPAQRARRAGADDEDVITIQDNNSYFVPSIIHSDTRLIESLKKLGYHLRSSWPVHERCLWLPLYPDRSYPFYWGFYSVRERQDALPVARRLLDVASCMISAWLAPEFVSLASQCLACA